MLQVQHSGGNESLLLNKTRSSPIGWSHHIGVLRLYCTADEWNAVLRVVFGTLVMVVDVYSNENSFYLEQVGQEAC